MLVPGKSKSGQVSGKAHAHNFQNTYLQDSDLAKPSQEVANQVYKLTSQSMMHSLQSKTRTTNYNPTAQIKSNKEPNFIRYTPHNQVQGTNSNAQQRIIKMHEVQKDPLMPAQFKHKKIAKGPGSPPPTIMHSPPRKLTAKDQLDWKIPPCISNWKNSKGYTIPLEMRLKADGRTLQHHTVNEHHAAVVNALYMAERTSRRELEERNIIQKSMAYKEYLNKEEQMRETAQRAREEKNKLIDEATEDYKSNKNNQDDEDQTLYQEREELRRINDAETRRDMRLQAAGNKKAKAVRDQERDISEKIALGQAQPTQNKEVMFDQRLFNQSSGLDQGYGSDDDYRVYDKPLFTDRTATQIYKQTTGGEVPDDEDEEKQQLERLVKQPNRAFSGAQGDDNLRGGSKNAPVQFEKHHDKNFSKKSNINDNDGDNIKKKVKRD